MNERIKLLAAQAWVDNDQLDACGYTDLEKFAQLIVRECMEQIHMQSRGPCGDNHGEWYESDILKHFGVES